MYDAIIVGAGLFGVTLANLLSNRGMEVVVVEKKDCIGGTCRTERVEGIDVHKYGAHIFRTNDKDVWKYVNRFAEFSQFINSPLTVSNGVVFNLPFNMNMFAKLWNIRTPRDAALKIMSQCVFKDSYNNLEEWAISQVGPEIYERFIKGYTEKQWGKSCRELPPSIMKRIPIRYTYDNNYYNAEYQGIPKCGYTKLMENMLNGIEVRLNVDGKSFVRDNKAKYIIYTGMIDEFYDYKYGALEYRSLRFEHEILDCSNYQGNAVVNYADADIPYTRTIEHCHFLKQYGNKTVVTYEYPSRYCITNEPYYPMQDDDNINLYRKYLNLSKDSGIIFSGRLGSYQYTDMDDTIKNAMKLYKEIIKEDKKNED